MISISVTKDTASPYIQKLKGLLESNGELAVVGARAVANVLKAHFAKLDTERHRGLTRSHFWGGVRRSVSAAYKVEGGAAVDIAAVGFAQRLFGGTINPVNGKYLAIPARDEAVGRSPREFTRLRFVHTRRGGALVETLSTRLTGATAKQNKSFGNIDGVLFWLVPSVTQKPDPSVMPTTDEMAKAAVEQMEKAIAHKQQGNP